MDASLFDVFHDTADDASLPIGNAVDIHLGGVFEETIDEDGAFGTGLGGGPDVAPQILLLMDNFHGSSAEHEGWSHQDRITDLVCDGDRLMLVCGGAALGLLKLQACRASPRNVADPRPSRCWPVASQ